VRNGGSPIFLPQIVMGAVALSSLACEVHAHVVSAARSSRFRSGRCQSYTKDGLDIPFLFVRMHLMTLTITDKPSNVLDGMMAEPAASLFP